MEDTRRGGGAGGRGGVGGVCQEMMGLVKRDRHSYREAFMNLLLFIAWILLALSCGVLGLWCVITVRLKLLLSRQPTVRAGLDLPEPEGSGGGSGGGLDPGGGRS